MYESAVVVGGYSCLPLQAPLELACHLDGARPDLVGLDDIVQFPKEKNGHWDGQVQKLSFPCKVGEGLDAAPPLAGRCFVEDIVF